MTHTPGPWSINNWPQADSSIAIGAVGTPLIARVFLRDVSINEQKANAHLIVAAAEMLAALEALKTANGSDNFTGWHESFAPAIALANAAIAKARGTL